MTLGKSDRFDPSFRPSPVWSRLPWKVYRPVKMHFISSVKALFKTKHPSPNDKRPSNASTLTFCVTPLVHPIEPFLDLDSIKLSLLTWPNLLFWSSFLEPLLPFGNSSYSLPFAFIDVHSFHSNFITILKGTIFGTSTCNHYARMWNFFFLVFFGTFSFTEAQKEISVPGRHLALHFVLP